jgi:L-asparaginase
MEIKNISSSTKKNNILIINTGGTFSSIETPDGLKPNLYENYLKEKLSPIIDNTEIKIIDLLDIDSANLHPNHWKLIADLIGKEYKNYDGIVIIHGTDTLSYTSSMLWNMLYGIPIPVVITGSQISIINPIADALENMRAAIYMAQLKYPGVYVAFNRKIILGKNCSKTHSMSFDAFESINEEYVAIINTFGMNINEKLVPKIDKNFQVKSDYDDRVIIITLSPGLKADIIDEYIKLGYKGFVIESYGLGGLPFINENYNFIEKCKEAIKKGIKIIVRSQCTYDGINLNVYETGIKTKEAGVINIEKTTREYAYTWLMWKLANDK